MTFLTLHARELEREIVFQQAKGVTKEREAEVPENQQTVAPGDCVYVKVTIPIG